MRWVRWGVISAVLGVALSIATCRGRPSPQAVCDTYLQGLGGISYASFRGCNLGPAGLDVAWRLTLDGTNAERLLDVGGFRPPYLCDSRHFARWMRLALDGLDLQPTAVDTNGLLVSRSNESQLVLMRAKGDVVIVRIRN
jgi:hypothetical protein